MHIINIGIIGYGGFGQFLHNAWLSLDGVKVIAVVDHHPEKLKNLQGAQAYNDWREMILNPDIDLVAIVTQPSSHEEIALACMEAGKHVFIEKPLAITLAEAESIMEARDRTGKVAAIDFIMRFNPLIQMLQKLTQSNVFGKLRRVAVENYAQDEQLPLEHWFWHPDRSGGILIEHAVHFIDLVHFISPAKLLSVNGQKHNRNAEQEDQVMANAVYEGGLVTTHYHSFSRPGFFETTNIKLSYDLADIALQGWIPLSGTIKILVNAETKQQLLSIPFFEPTSSIPIDQATDESRPKGWGLIAEKEDAPTKIIRSSGISYEVNEVVEGRFQLQQSKQEVYKTCVQESLLDVVHKINNPNHTLNATLESGYESLKVAVLATESARNVM